MRSGRADTLPWDTHAGSPAQQRNGKPSRQVRTIVTIAWFAQDDARAEMIGPGIAIVTVCSGRMLC